MATVPQDLFHANLLSLSNTDNAWTTASTAGAAHVQSVSNALLTFADLAVTPSPSPPSPHHLSSLHNSATQSLSWLHTTLLRLTAALRGARQTEHTIANAATNKPQPQTPHHTPTTFTNTLHKLPLHTYHMRITEINDAMERDLKDKQHVYRVLQHATQGAYVSKHDLELGVALWLEQPQRIPGEAAMLVAAYEAENAAAEDTFALPVSSPIATRTASRGRVDKAESPAVAMLREAGKRRGG